MLLSGLSCARASIHTNVVEDRFGSFEKNDLSETRKFVIEVSKRREKDAVLQEEQRQDK